MHAAYWLMIIITFGYHDELKGPQPVHYESFEQCEDWGRALVKDYAPTKPDEKPIEPYCTPTYAP